MRFGVGLAVISVMLPTSSVVAEKQEKPRGFCDNLSSISARVLERVPQREDFRNKKLDSRTTKIDEHLALRMTKLEDKRDGWDNAKSGKYEKLEANAKTDDQKLAIKNFKTTVDTAVTARRNAVDAAVSSFKTGVNNLLAGRQTQINSAFSTLATSTKVAVDAATASCAGGTDPATVRAKFMSDIKAANTAFKTAVKPTNISSDVEALRLTRDKAVKTATEAFKATVKQATATLRTALGKS